jgi:hypothetical protein
LIRPPPAVRGFLIRRRDRQAAAGLSKTVGTSAGVVVGHESPCAEPPTVGGCSAQLVKLADRVRDGYLGTVDYGFRDTGANSWRLRLRYRATTGGQLVDSRPGSFPRSAAVDGYPFYSYMSYSPKFHLLADSEQHEVKEKLPFYRVGADEPTANFGTTTTGHGYARNGTGVVRDVYVAAS